MIQIIPTTWEHFSWDYLPIAYFIKLLIIPLFDLDLNERRRIFIYFNQQVTQIWTMKCSHSMSYSWVLSSINIDKTYYNSRGATVFKTFFAVHLWFNNKVLHHSVIKGHCTSWIDFSSLFIGS